MVKDHLVQENLLLPWTTLPVQARSGQVRVFNCTFRSSCCSARLSCAHVLAFFAESSVWDRKKGGREYGCGDRLQCWVHGNMSSPTGIGSRQSVIWGVMEFGMSHRIKPKEKGAHFNEGNLVQFGRSIEKSELWSYVVSFEFSRPKSSSLPVSRTESFICITQHTIQAIVVAGRGDGGEHARHPVPARWSAGAGGDVHYGRGVCGGQQGVLPRAGRRPGAGRSQPPGSGHRQGCRSGCLSVSRSIQQSIHPTIHPSHAIHPCMQSIH